MDSEGCAVAACVAAWVGVSFLVLSKKKSRKGGVGDLRDDGDFAMGGDEGSSRESEEEVGGIHGDGWMDEYKYGIIVCEKLACKIDR